MMFWILFCVIGDFADLFNKFNANTCVLMIEWTTIIRWKTTGTNHEAKYFEKNFQYFSP